MTQRQEPSSLRRRVARWVGSVAVLTVAAPLLAIMISAPATAAPALCGTPGLDGDGVGITGVVNTYFPGTANAAAGATSINLGASAGASAPIATGDLVLVVQMQDAEIATNNSSAYGANDTTGRGSSAVNQTGKYEYVRATSSLVGGVLNVVSTGTGGGLRNAYNQSAATNSRGRRTFQAVRVPQYRTASLGAALTAMAWNGGTGGILAIDVAGALSVGTAAVSVVGKGFRGGGARQQTGAGGLADTDYRTASSKAANGSKGEGIAGTPRFVHNNVTDVVVDNTAEGYPQGSFAKGAPGTAGGGGTDGDPANNDENSGGGGGGNAGTGGKGGNAWQSQDTSGGIGGGTFTSSASAFVLGGGGGAATRNNSADTATSGGAGGGMMLFRVGSTAGTGATFTADGADGPDNPGSDGAGGAGGGGSAIVTATGALNALTVTARGGVGGDAFAAAAANGNPGERHGPGGGGGGGVVRLSANTPVTDVTGGAHGVTTTSASTFGSANGGNGTSVKNTSITTIPGASSGAECATDLSVAMTAPANVSSAAATIPYTITVSDTGALGALTPSWTVTTPTGTRFGSVTPPLGWACTTPAVGASGAVTCTASGTLASGSNAVFTLNLQRTATSGTVTASVSTATPTPESNSTNNSASVVTTVWPAPLAQADPMVTPAGSPLTVAAPGVLGNDTGYTLAVTSNTAPSHGTVTVASGGAVNYTPTAGYSGPDSFTYTVTDGFGRPAVGTVNITVTPVAVTDAYAAVAGTPFVAAPPGVLGNDLGSSLTVTSSTTPAQGTRTINANGSFTYTATAGFSGTDSFAYTVTDPSGGTATGIVNFSVSLPPPTFAVGDVSVAEGNSGTTNLTFTISLSRVATTAATVAWSTASGTAAAGADFLAGSGVATVPVGESSTTVSVVVNGELLYEPDEAFTVVLTAPTNATIADPTGVGTIVTDDETIYVDAAPDQVDAIPGDHYCASTTGVCTPRAAVQESNARTGVQPIVLQSAVTYTLSIVGGGEDAGATGDLDVLDLTSITGNNATLDGNRTDRVLDVNLPAGTFALSDLTITHGDPPGVEPANIGGGLLLQGSAATSLTNVRVVDNHSGYSGGGILSFSPGGLTITGGTVSGNSAVAAAGIAALTQLTVVNTTFDGNIAGQVAGGIYGEGVTSLTGVVFSNNVASVAGAGVFQAAGSFTMSGGAFNDNSSNIVGAGLTLTANASLTNVDMLRNRAAFGPALSQVTGTLTVNGGRFADNVAVGNGGAVLVESVATFTNATLESNSAVDGGAIAVLGTTLTVNGGSIRNNTASGNGGGITSYQGAVNLNGVSVTGNSAAMGGGVLTVDATTITNSTIDNNTASVRAGGVFFASPAPVTITGSTINGNTSEDAGAMFTAGTGAITINRTEMSNNTATGLAGGLMAITGSITFSQSTIAGNNGGIGSAVVTFGDVTLDRSTVSGNVAGALGTVVVIGPSSGAPGGSVTLRDATVTANTGVGINNGLGGSATSRNSIVADNTQASCAGPVTSTGYNLSSDTSCGFTQPTDVQGVSANLGALAANGGPTRTHLPNAGSPVVDSGDPTCAVTDQRGVARPTGGGCDRGAAER